MLSVHGLLYRGIATYPKVTWRVITALAVGQVHALASLAETSQARILDKRESGLLNT